MKKLFYKSLADKPKNGALLLFRIGIALLMLTHGVPKLAQFFSGEPVAFANVLGMGQTISLVLAIFAEVFCSVLILLGMGTRLAAIPLIITMLVAVLHIHSGDPFARKEMGIHYLLAYVFLFMTGSGKYSLDYILAKSYLTTPGRSATQL